MTPRLYAAEQAKLCEARAAEARAAGRMNLLREVEAETFREMAHWMIGPPRAHSGATPEEMYPGYYKALAMRFREGQVCTSATTSA